MTKPEVKPIRGQVLQAAMDATLGSRNKSYGAPNPNLQLANNLIAAVHPFLKDKYSPAHNQAIYLALHKLARIACGAVGHTDNYVDAAAYFAIAAECEDIATKAIEAGLYTPQSNYYTTGSDLVDPITGDTSDMIADIERQNVDASRSEIKSSERFDHYGESITPKRIVKVGDTFSSNRSDDTEDRRIWAVIKIVSPKRYQVECVNSKESGDIGIVEYRSEGDIDTFYYADGTSILKCIHCPSDAAPNKDVCIKCAMELGQ